MYLTAIKKITKNKNKKKILWKKNLTKKNFIFNLNVFNSNKKKLVINKRWIQKEEKIKDAK